MNRVGVVRSPTSPSNTHRRTWATRFNIHDLISLFWYLDGARTITIVHREMNHGIPFNLHSITCCSSNIILWKVDLPSNSCSLFTTTPIPILVFLVHLASPYPAPSHHLDGETTTITFLGSNLGPSDRQNIIVSYISTLPRPSFPSLHHPYPSHSQYAQTPHMVYLAE